MVWARYGMLGSFDIFSGKKQGCCLLGLCFSLFLNNLIDFIGGGVEINGKIIRSLLYADNIAILAINPKALQEIISRIQLYFELWNLKINLLKSKTMVRGNGYVQGFLQFPFKLVGFVM